MRCLPCAIALAACAKDPAPPPPPPACTPAHPPVTGEATHYKADGTGKCSFDDTGDRLVAAVSGPDFDAAAWCGACLVVTGPDDTEIVVRVTDKCPACKPGDLDLSREAFELLAPLARGRIPITWLAVPCDVRGPIEYRFKDRSNESWTGIQIRNHRYPIARVEARDRLGAWTAVARADYNYFVAPTGLGRSPYTLRVTDTRGHVVEDMIAVGDGVARTGAAQFAACR